jgi:hypothetical protein
MLVSEDMLIDTVDSQDVPSGVIRRSEALPTHANFRVVHVFLFNRHNELLIQQLSPIRGRCVDSGRCRSAFRNDVDQDYELMSITIPTRCRSQIATVSEW